MRKTFLILVVQAIFLTVISFGVVAEEELEFVGGSFIGEFPVGASLLSPAMKLQIQKDIALFPRGEKLYVKFNSFSDDSGSDKANEKIVIDRMDTVISMYIDIMDDMLVIVESNGHIYKAGKNEVNKRFVSVEYFLPKKQDMTVNYQKVLEDLKGSFDQSVSDYVSETTKRMDVISIDIEEIKKSIYSVQKHIISLSKSNEKVAATVVAGFEATASAIDGVNESVNASANATKSSFKRIYLYGISATLACLILFFLGARMFRIKTDKVSEQTERIEIDVKKVLEKGLIIGKPIEKERATKTKIDGVLIEIRYLYERDVDGNETFYSPFHFPSGDPVYRKTYKQMISSFKGHYKNHEYSDQLSAMLADGTIQILN